MNLRDWRIEWDTKFRANKCKATYTVKGSPHFTYKMIGCEQTQDHLPVIMQEDDLGGVVDSSMETSTQCSLPIKITLQRAENKTENTAMPLSASWLFVHLSALCSSGPLSLTGYSRIGKDSEKGNKDHICGNLDSIQGSME